MVDTTFIGLCQVCGGLMIEDEPRVACDSRGYSTGDYADTINGRPQTCVAHPGCTAKVEPDPDEETA